MGCLKEFIIGCTLVILLIGAALLFCTNPGNDYALDTLNMPSTEVTAFISGGTKEVAVCAPLMPFIAGGAVLFALYMKCTSDSRHG